MKFLLAAPAASSMFHARPLALAAIERPEASTMMMIWIGPLAGTR
jgi:hypothetical protein